MYRQESQSGELFRIKNNILNKDKQSFLVNGPVFISSSSDKAELFAKKLFSNSTLEYKSHSLPDLSLLKDQKRYLYLGSSKELNFTGPNQIRAIYKHVEVV